jgi:hypothetical protein
MARGSDYIWLSSLICSLGALEQIGTVIYLYSGVTMSLLLALLVAGASTRTTGLELFVGHSSSSSTSNERRFATVRAAVAAIHTLPRSVRCASGGVTITITGGVHSGGIGLMSEDSGCDTSTPLVIRADPADSTPVVVHAGIEVPPGAFRKAARLQHTNLTVWKADLGALAGGQELAASSGNFQRGWVCANANGSRSEFFFGGQVNTCTYNCSYHQLATTLPRCRICWPHL